MGNILSLSSSKDNPKDDEKWLKMPANELFDLEVNSLLNPIYFIYLQS